MSAPNTRPVGLAQLADDLLAFAIQEAREGYQSTDNIRVRDAAEKAWNAVIQATDLAMRARGRPPTPGPMAHDERHRFFETIGRRDLQRKYSFFADRLHGSCFYQGNIPKELEMDVWLAEVRQYIDEIKAGL